MTATLFLCFVVFVLLGVPISFVLGIAAIITLVFIGGYPIQVIVQRMFTAVDSFPLMAIPFFMLAGSLMDRGGITRRIIDLANALVGFLRGGLAHVAIISGVILAGISGSAVADTAAIGSILVPEMSRRGYSREFSGAVVSAAGIIGPIIPPSIPMIIYGVLAQTSIGDLFIGGILVGLLIAIGFMIVAYWTAVKHNYPTEMKVPLKEVWARFKSAIWALFMPVIIIGGIRGGIFTPTEGGVVAAVYGLFMGLFVYKELKLRDLPEILGEAVISTAVVSFLIATASLFSWILASERIPQAVAAAFLAISNNKYVILFLINILLLIVGMFLDVAPALILFMPVLLPLVSSMGVDLVHFGVVVTLNLAIGLLTPPVGTALYVACNIAKVPLGTLSLAVLRFIAVVLIVLFLATYIPGIVLWLPNALK